MRFSHLRNGIVIFLICLAVFYVSRPFWVGKDNIDGERSTSPPVETVKDLGNSVTTDTALLGAQVNNAPRIFLEEAVYDYGHMAPVETISHVFKFRNIGGNPLVISRLAPCCGASANLIAPKEIAPGKVGSIKLTCIGLPSRPNGSHSVERFVDIYSNDPQNPKVVAKVKATILPVPQPSPSSLYFFFDEPENQEKFLTIAGPPGEFLLEGITTSHSDILARVVSSEENTQGLIKIAVSVPSSSMTLVSENIIVALDNKDVPQIEIPILVRQAEVLEVTPNRIFLGTVSAGQLVSRRLVVSGKYTTRSKITVSKTQLKFVSVEVARVAEEANQYNLSIEIGDDAFPGIINDTIEFETNIPEKPAISLPIYGIVK